PNGSVKPSKVDARIDELRLRRQRPGLVERELVAGLDAERVAKSVIAVGERRSERGRADVAVQPAHLRLRVDIEPVHPVPGEAAADAIALRIDLAEPVGRGNVAVDLPIMNGKPRDQSALVAVMQQAVNAGLQPPQRL